LLFFFWFVVARVVCVLKLIYFLYCDAASCSFDVTVEDNRLPSITCPPNINTVNEAGTCGAVVTYSVVETGSCGATTVQNSGLPSGAQFPIGTTNNMFTISDSSGNAGIDFVCPLCIAAFQSTDPRPP
jgi:hypothetical protein